MALPTPLNILRLNARVNSETTFVQEGKGFTSTPPVTVTDLDSGYSFSVISVLLHSSTRLQLTVRCTGVPANKVARTRIKIVTNPGATNEDDTGPVPVILMTRRQPVINHSGFKKQRVRLKVGEPSVVFVPITGLGDVIAATAIADQGTWSVKARQLARRLKLTLKCLTTLVSYASVSSDCIDITLTTEDDEVIDFPVDVDYVKDPDEDPDP